MYTLVPSIVPVGTLLPTGERERCLGDRLGEWLLLEGDGESRFRFGDIESLFGDFLLGTTSTFSSCLGFGETDLEWERPRLSSEDCFF